jgi:putative FmdB family regulatory protein
MPLYEYECDACGHRFEVIEKFSDPPVEVCKECGKGPVRRLFSSPAIQFKGSGWYITDYAKKGTSDAATPAGKSDTAKSDSTSDTAAKTDTAKSDTPKSDSSASASKSKDASASKSKE